MRSRTRIAVAVVTAAVSLGVSTGQALAAAAGGSALPAPVNRTLFLRNSDSANCADYHLSDADGPDAGNGCAKLLGFLSPVDAVGPFEDAYPTSDEVAVPITVDASKPVTGQLAIVSVFPNALQFDIVVKLGNVTLPAKVVDAGVYANSWFLDDAVVFPFSIAIPASLDKKDVDSAEIKVVWHRDVNAAGSTRIELEDPASYFTVPAYDHSFSA